MTEIPVGFCLLLGWYRDLAVRSGFQAAAASSSVLVNHLAKGLILPESLGGHPRPSSGTGGAARIPLTPSLWVQA